MGVTVSYISILYYIIYIYIYYVYYIYIYIYYIYIYIYILYMFFIIRQGLRILPACVIHKVSVLGGFGTSVSGTIHSWSF